MWYIVACVPDKWSNAIDGPFRSENEAESRLMEIKDPSNLDPFYTDLMEQNGSIWIDEQ